MALNRDGRRRIARGGLAACAVVVALVPSSAFAFKAGTYSGTTSQNDTAGDPKPLQLKVNKKKNKLNIVFFELEAPPCGGAGGLQWAGKSTAIRASGKFNFVDEFGYGFIKGQFQHNEAEGTAHWHGGTCDTGDITWTAERSSP